MITAHKYKPSYTKGVIFLAFTCLSLLYLGSCASKKTTTSAQQEVEADRKKQAFLSLLIDGTQALFLGDMMKAEDKLYKAYDLEPENPEILFRLSQLESKRNNANKSLDFAAKSWEKGWENQAEYSLNYAEILTISGRLKEAMEVLKKGTAAHPKDQKLTTSLAISYAKNGDAQKALQTVQNFEKSRGTNQLTLITRAQILSISKNPAANQAWEKAFLANPENGEVLLWWFKQLKHASAEELKTPIHLLLTQTPSTQLYELIKEGINLCKQSAMTEEALELTLLGIQHPEITVAQKSDLSGELTSLLTSGKLAHTTDNLVLLEQLIEKQPESSSLQQIAAKLAFDLGNIVKSKDYFTAAKKRGELSLENHLTFFHVLLYQNDWLAIEKQAEQALMLYPQSMDISLWKGAALLVQQKKDFSDWYDENYSFMIDESDKANTEFLNNLYKGQFKLSQNLSFITNQSTAFPVLWAVNTTGNYLNIIKKELLFFHNISNIHEGLNEKDQAIWNAFGMLKTEDYQKAVEMLKKEEQNLTNNPLFCELYGFALIKTNQKETGEKWRSKAISLDLAKPVF